MQHARSAASELQGADAGGNLIQSVDKFNPGWAEQIEQAVRDVNGESQSGA
jgi:hypothetical protein